MEEQFDIDEILNPILNSGLNPIRDEKESLNLFMKSKKQDYLSFLNSFEQISNISEENEHLPNNSKKEIMFKLKNPFIDLFSAEQKQNNLQSLDKFKIRVEKDFKKVQEYYKEEDELFNNDEIIKKEDELDKENLFGEDINAKEEILDEEHQIFGRKENEIPSIKRSNFVESESESESDEESESEGEDEITEIEEENLLVDTTKSDILLLKLLTDYVKGDKIQKRSQIGYLPSSATTNKK